MKFYVYAYDVYGARTYFITPEIPKYAKESRSNLIAYLSKLAAKKLSVSPVNIRLGEYSSERFDQGHLPSHVYKKGKWVSYTTQD